MIAYTQYSVLWIKTHISKVLIVACSQSLHIIKLMNNRSACTLAKQQLAQKWRYPWPPTSSHHQAPSHWITQWNSYQPILTTPKPLNPFTPEAAKSGHKWSGYLSRLWHHQLLPHIYSQTVKQDQTFPTIPKPARLDWWSLQYAPKRFKILAKNSEENLPFLRFACPW